MAAGEDSFVSIGTAFDVPEEDAPKKKALPVHDQFATDNEGRRRFHGAFTGGFSAGYFNTVGSKEGWQPSTFISSRSQRFESSRQKPEDFMDEEDLGEFGIAPKNVETTRLFSREHESGEKRIESSASVSAVSLNSMIKYALEDLVVPCRMSIGVRLLKKMGWKEGQGIGPRVRRHSKKKVYGCLPPGRADKENEDSDHDIYAEGLLFAPKDTTTIKFTPKDNLHGIGYKGMLAPVPMEFSKPGFSGNLKIKGQAFGVGAFEDDDEDVYTQDSMSNYDIELHDRKPSQSDHHGWTGPPRQAIEGGTLSLFAKASKPRPANKVFSPPSVPRGYQPFVDAKETYDVKRDEKTASHLTSEARGELLGEKPLQKTVKSVFDLMSKDDRERITSTKKTVEINCTAVKSPLTQQLSNVRVAGFQPFAKYPAKQARYENFLEARRSVKESDVPNELRCGLTEWEREREKEEFSRAAMLYQPLKGDMAARFRRGKNIDDDTPDTNYREFAKSKTVEEKAAEMKMFGKLTRNTFEWHPAKLLCKRFNLPEPYPSSSRAGLVHEKKAEKFTLAQLFETSPNLASDETNKVTAVAVSSSTSTTENAVETVSRANVNTNESVKLNTDSDAVVTSEQQPSEKPSMDLFKAIFASSSEEEPDSSEDEATKPPVEYSNAEEKAVQFKTSNEDKFEATCNDDQVDKTTFQDVNDVSSNQIAKQIPEENDIEENAMEAEEYGPRPPPPRPQKEENFPKLKFQSRQTEPFSRHDSNSDSDSDRPKKKHKRKQKHKSKHKSKDKDKDRACKKDKDKLRSNDGPRITDSQKYNFNEETSKAKNKEIPDDKQILSKLKAVQKRRMCAADFM